MVKERLSTLQKWILVHSYNEANGKTYRAMKKIDILRFWHNTYTLGSQTFVIIDNFKPFFSESEYNKACATITRSLWNLYDKGYVKLIGKQSGGYVLDYDKLSQDIGGLSQDEYVEKHLKEGMPNLNTVSASTPMGVLPVPECFCKKVDDYLIDVSKGDGHNICFVFLTDKGVEVAKSLKLSSAQTDNLTLRNPRGDLS